MAKAIERTLAGLALLALAGGLAPAATADEPADEPAAESRSTIVRLIPSGGRDGAVGEARRFGYDKPDTEGTRATRSSRSEKAGSAAEAAGSNDFWFYTADVQLYNDDDRDGYYHGIDLLFDADTVFSEVDVYAAVFLSYQGGPWDEVAVTDDFTIFGATSDDEYVVLTELESGFPTGDYDLLIELYDAFDGAFLAEFGPADTSELSFLPLEDYQRDAPRDGDVIVGHRGGGGAAAGLLLFCATWLGRRLAVRRGRCA